MGTPHRGGLRAVWSFWTKPYLDGGHRAWHCERAHLLSWALSVSLARPHFTRLELVTDTPGQRLLVETLGLPFDSVSTALDALDDRDPTWWVTGKLATYSMQTDPFVHIDNDVFLWTALPRSLTAAAVLFQNPEYFVPGAPDSYYEPHVAESLVARYGGCLPEEWHHFRASGCVQWAACCGIVGGNAVALLRSYAVAALATLLHARNRAPLKALALTGTHHNVLFEQYLLAAYLECHHNELAGPVSVLFADQQSAFDGTTSEALGYTHLMGTAKRSPDVEARLARRARETCRSLAQIARELGPDALSILAATPRSTTAQACRCSS